MKGGNLLRFLLKLSSKSCNLLVGERVGGGDREGEGEGVWEKWERGIVGGGRGSVVGEGREGV